MQSVRTVDTVHEPATQVDGGLRRSCPSQSAAPQTVPSEIGEHVPCLPAIAHELQLVQAATPQQYPSVQCPLMHSADAAQTLPFGLRFVHE